jgi:hypothetical protein
VKYAYLLTKQSEITEWFRTKREIKDYKAKLSQFTDLYEEILRDLPYYIRMNLVLVDCTNIKKRLLDEVTAIKGSLYQSMYEHVKKLNSDIYRKIDGIK